MKQYTQLSYDERVVIAYLIRQRKSYYAIAKQLGRTYETIKHEVERNGHINNRGEYVYHAKRAQKKHRQRRAQSKIGTRIIENNPRIERRICELITHKQYSPEQIAHRYDTVSHQTIYNYIYRMDDTPLRRDLIAHLRRGGKTYRRRKPSHDQTTSIAPKTMIDKRPQEINERTELGHFEGDTVHVYGRMRLLTLVDRKSRYVIIRPLCDGTAETVRNAINEIHKQYRSRIRSLTFDNGPEFAYHDLITLDTTVPIYFAHPYCSWERGTNENTNGLIRQYIPKGKTYDILTEKDIAAIEKAIDHRPRKCLNWMTAHEVFIEGKKPEDFEVQALI